MDVGLLLAICVFGEYFVLLRCARYCAGRGGCGREQHRSFIIMVLLSSAPETSAVRGRPPSRGRGGQAELWEETRRMSVCVSVYICVNMCTCEPENVHPSVRL